MDPKIEYSGSPVLQKLMRLKFPKLDTTSLNSIISTARHMTSSVSPSNCSQNLKASFQDPDKALEHGRRKNMLFESYIRHELSKLNCSKHPIDPSDLSKPIIKSHRISPVRSHPIAPKPLQPKKNIKPTKKPIPPSIPVHSSLCTFSKSIDSAQMTLPPLVKSTPLYLDPSYCFPKRKSTDLSSTKETISHKRMNSLDEVNKKCDEFWPDCKHDIEEVKKMQVAKKVQKVKIQEYLEDFSVCLRMAKDQEAFENGMSTRVYNRKLDDGFRKELDQLREGLLEVTRDAIECRGQKVWRLKNAVFLADTDKLINSVPTRNN